MSGEALEERERAVLEAATNGEHKDELETVEVPREEFEALLERVEELEQQVKDNRIDAAKDRAGIKARVSDLEDGQRVSNSEPSTKVERVRDRIVENFEKWSVEFKKGRAVATDVSDGEAAGVKKNITKWVKESVEDSVSIQYKTVYDAMEKVDKDYAGYEYEEVQRNGERKRYLWWVKDD